MKSKIFLLCFVLTANTFIVYAQGGELDNTFGTNGKVTRQSSNANAVANQTDGKIVAGGNVVNSGINVFAVFRYNADGTQDNTFGSNGTATTTFDLASSAVCKSIVVQTDGKIVAVGAATSTTGNGQMFVVARFNSNGTLDNSFGTNGRVETIIGLSQSGARGVALQQDGKIVITGDESNGDDIDIVLIRYKTNGTPDSSFSGDGIVINDLVWDDYSNALVIQPDGKIIIAGATSDYDDYYRVYLQRRVSLQRFNMDRPEREQQHVLLVQRHCG